MEREHAQSEGEPCCKVGRISREYGLDELDEELERRWTGTGGESASLRELQRAVNRRVLGESLSAAGVPPIQGEAENLRKVLASSDVSESRRIEARRRLEKNEGVDVDQLLADFVSHQTVYNHLRNCRDVSRSDERSDEERLSQAKSTVFGLQNRTELVTEQTLSQLVSDGLVAPENFDVVVDIQVICDECGRSHGFESLVERGECHCH
jgi:hypothetical protein